MNFNFQLICKSNAPTTTTSTTTTTTTTPEVNILLTEPGEVSNK